MKFGLSQSELALLNEILLVPLKKYHARIWIFGSRARGDHQKFSDVDVLYSLPKGTTLPPGFLFTLKDDLVDSNLPYKVDVVCEEDLAEGYRDSVMKDRIEI